MLGINQRDDADRRSPPLVQIKKFCVEASRPTAINAQIQISDALSHKGKVKKKPKSVTFDDTNLEEIIEFEDDIESQNIRKLYWERMALDRTRFQDRVGRLESVLSPILSTTHRKVVYMHRILETQTSVSAFEIHKVMKF